ncbi:hypothetical protein D3C87_703230 [compost metagenome]
MAERTWLEVRTAANACLIIMNKRLSAYEDPVKTVFDNNLPSAMKEIAVYTFINGEEGFDPELLADIRDGFAQVNTKGFIGNG